MELKEAESIIEGVLFAAGDPVHIEKLSDILDIDIKKSFPIQSDFPHIDLVRTASFINTHTTKDNYLLSFAHMKRESAAMPCKHHTGNRSRLIL